MHPLKATHHMAQATEIMSTDVNACTRTATAQRSSTWPGLLALAAIVYALAGCGSSAGSDSGNGQQTGQQVTRPTAVATSTRFVSAEAGNWHMCMLAVDGRTLCWGSNERGQLGAATTQHCMDGTLDCSTVPLVAASGVIYKQVVAGDLVTCGLTLAGAASCWGIDLGGQLGDGLGVSSTSPVAVADNHVFAALAASESTGLVCGLTEDASVWCWGTGFGFGTKGPVASATPVRWDAISGIIVWTKLALGQGHACGLDATGHAWCVGSASYGLLGDGVDVASASPVPVAGGHMFRDIAASIQHTCALTQDGQAWCWGLGAGVGNGAATSAIQNAPVAVSTDQRFTSIAVAANRSCALTADGQAWCWGDNSGDGTSQTRTTPVAVADNHRFNSLATSNVASCGVDTDGVAWCWGVNDTGALGIPPN